MTSSRAPIASRRAKPEERDLETISARELLALHSARSKLSAEKVEQLVGDWLEQLKEELTKGRSVLIDDFGTIRLLEKKAQILTNPETGHQFIDPARNIVDFRAEADFEQQIKKARLSSIVLAAPADDAFAGVIKFHFSKAGWRVQVVETHDECMQQLAEGACLVIVDSQFEGALELVEAVKCSRDFSLVPLIVLYPEDLSPESSSELLVLGNEHLVEPFQVYDLLMLAESELTQSQEEGVLFEQQTRFQFGSSEENLKRATALGEKLFQAAGLQGEELTMMIAAYSEAIGNAARHGNRGDAQKQVSVLYLLDKEKITLVVRDQGDGFDHKSLLAKARARNSAVEAARERHLSGGTGGLGIMLMVRCCDDVEYDATGNILTLTKLIPKDPAARGLPARS